MPASSSPPQWYHTLECLTSRPLEARFFSAYVEQVEPIDLQLSTDEAIFRFNDGSLDPTISQVRDTLSMRRRHEAALIDARLVSADCDVAQRGHASCCLPLGAPGETYEDHAGFHALRPAGRGITKKSSYAHAHRRSPSCFCSIALCFPCLGPAIGSCQKELACRDHVHTVPRRAPTACPNRDR